MKVHLIHSTETRLPIGFTLRHGINTVFTVQSEQIPLVQVYQTTKTLALQTEVDEPVKKIIFSVETDFCEFTAKFEQLANQVVTEHNLIAQMSQLGPRESINDDGELEESKLRVSTVNPILSEQMRS